MGDEERAALMARLRRRMDGWRDGTQARPAAADDLDYRDGHDRGIAAQRVETRATRRELGLDGLALVRGGK